MNKNKIIKILSKLYLKLLGKECVVLKHNPLMHYMEEGSKTYARYNPVLAVNLVITDYFNDHQTRPIITNIGIEEDENKIEVTLHTNRPGLIIGYGGGTFDELEKRLTKIFGKIVKLHLKETRMPFGIDYINVIDLI